MVTATIHVSRCALNFALFFPLSMEWCVVQPFVTSFLFTFLSSALRSYILQWLWPFYSDSVSFLLSPEFVKTVAKRPAPPNIIINNFCENAKILFEKFRMTSSAAVAVDCVDLRARNIFWHRAVHSLNYIAPAIDSVDMPNEIIFVTICAAQQPTNRNN